MVGVSFGRFGGFEGEGGRVYRKEEEEGVGGWSVDAGKVLVEAFEEEGATGLTIWQWEDSVCHRECVDVKNRYWWFGACMFSSDWDGVRREPSGVSMRGPDSIRPSVAGVVFHLFNVLAIN